MDERMVEGDGGRLIGVASGGATAAPRAVVVHHGTPSDARSWDDWEAAVGARGLRLVAADRAGYASSARQRGRTVADAAADGDVAVEALGVSEFVAIGLSGAARTPSPVRCSRPAAAGPRPSPGSGRRVIRPSTSWR